MFNNNEFEFLDGLNIVSFIAQIVNIAQDEESGKYMQMFVKAIANEIEQLHKENDIIMEQNEKIIQLLTKARGYNGSHK